MTGRTLEARTQLPRLLIVLLVSVLALGTVNVMTAPRAAAATCPSREVHRIRGWLHTCGTRIVDSHHHIVRPLSVGMWDMARDTGRNKSLCLHWQRPSAGSYSNLHNWGFNAVLLYISWANVEPRRPTWRGHWVHHYNRTYLRALDGVIHRFARHGVRTILDMANNRWSSAFTRMKLPNGSYVPCGFGMPKWLYPRGGGLRSMVRAEKHFFTHPRGRTQAWFARAWRVVAHRYRRAPAVIGANVLHEAYDLLVQDYPLTSRLGPRDMKLAGFYERAGRAIHRGNRHLLIFTGDYLDRRTKRFALVRRPRVSHGVWDSEFYAANWNPQGLNRMKAFHRRAVRWHRPMWIEEFTAFLSTGSATWAIDTRGYLSYTKSRHIGWSFVPYSRLPNNPPGLLTLLQSGF